MHFKLICAFVEEEKTDAVLEAARDKGATGSTIINNARGEGITSKKTFLGMELASQRDFLLLLVEEHLSREILEHIAEVGEFDETSGSGMAFMIDVEDAVGINHQVSKLHEIVEGEL